MLPIKNITKNTTANNYSALKKRENLKLKSNLPEQILFYGFPQDYT